MTCAVFLTPRDSNRLKFLLFLYTGRSRPIRFPKSNKMHLYLLSIIWSSINKSEPKYHAMFVHCRLNSVKCDRKYCRPYKRSNKYFFLHYIDQMQKWTPTNYSFVFVLISLTSLVLQPKFFQFYACERG